MNKIILKYGEGYPYTSLDLAEPALDASDGILYIGTGVGSDPLPFYPYQQTADVSISFDILDGGNAWTIINTNLFDGGSW